MCEKATTSNAAETKALIKLAKEKNLFFMEALWTRFHPLTLELKKIAEEGTLGDPVVLHADLSADFHIEGKPCTLIAWKCVVLNRFVYRTALDSQDARPEAWWRCASGSVSGF